MINHEYKMGKDKKKNKSSDNKKTKKSKLLNNVNNGADGSKFPDVTDGGVPSSSMHKDDTKFH